MTALLTAMYVSRLPSATFLLNCSFDNLQCCYSIGLDTLTSDNDIMIGHLRNMLGVFEVRAVVAS